MSDPAKGKFSWAVAGTIFGFALLGMILYDVVVGPLVAGIGKGGGQT